MPAARRIERVAVFGGCISTGKRGHSLPPSGMTHETVSSIISAIHGRGRTASFVGSESSGACSVAVALKIRGNGLT